MVCIMKTLILYSLIASMGVCCFSVLADGREDSHVNLDKPNIIYILADDLGYGDIGAFGQEKIKTPYLDALAREGMRFTQHYAGNTVCAPSRASLITGKHPGKIQIRGNFEIGTFLDEEEWGQLPLWPGTTTVATVLQDAGYKTAIVGKWGLGGAGSHGEPNKQGFDYFFGYLDQKQAHNHYPSHLWENEERFDLDNKFMIPHATLPDDADPNNPKSYEPYKRGDYAQDRLTNKAIEFIDENQKKPFFLYLAYAIPHPALQVPEKALEEYSHFEESPYQGRYIPLLRPRAARAAMISYMDRDVGRIIKLLKELQLDKNTLVVFSSDNGAGSEGGADLDFFKSNGLLRGEKRDLYEGGIRTPTIAWFPGVIDGGSKTDHLSAFWDVLPTFAELAGAEPPEGVDGISFLPTLLGNIQEEKHNHLYWEFHKNTGGHAQAVRFDISGDKWKAVRVYTRTNKNNPKIELYKLNEDVSEKNDISDEYPDLVSKAEHMMNTSHTRSFVDFWNFDYWPD